MTSRFDFAFQSTCIFAVANQEDGETYYVKSPGCMALPMREHKMMSVLVNSAISAKEISESGVIFKEAIGSALRIVWKTIGKRFVFNLTKYNFSQNKISELLLLELPLLPI